MLKSSVSAFDRNLPNVSPQDQSFRAHLAALENSGDLVRFDKEVDPELNLSAIEWKTYAEFGKASLFTNIKGHPGWRVCSQIIADRRKWALGLGIEEDRLHDEILKRMRSPIPSQLIDAASAPVKELKLLGTRRRSAGYPCRNCLRSGFRPLYSVRNCLHQGPGNGHRKHVLPPYGSAR